MIKAFDLREQIPQMFKARTSPSGHRDIPLPAVLDKTHLIDFTSLDEGLLKQICSFLSPFDKTIEELSDDERPTLYRVTPLLRFLMEKCHQVE